MHCSWHASSARVTCFPRIDPLVLTSAGSAKGYLYKPVEYLVSSRTDLSLGKNIDSTGLSRGFCCGSDFPPDIRACEISLVKSVHRRTIVRENNVERCPRLGSRLRPSIWSSRNLSLLLGKSTAVTHCRSATTDVRSVTYVSGSGRGPLPGLVGHSSTTRPDNQFCSGTVFPMIDLRDIWQQLGGG